MPALHETAATKALSKWMRDPAGASALQQVVAGLHEDRYDHFWVDSVGQLFRHAPCQWPMEQMLAFALMHFDLCRGRVGVTDIATEATPAADRRREENADVLSRLPDPFIAEVDMTQYGAEGDGTLRWTSPIRVSIAEASERSPGGRLRPVLREILMPPGVVPLEIGTSDPSRTVVHVRERQGVARWPYHYEKIRLFLDLSELAPSEIPSFEAVMAVRPSRACRPSSPCGTSHSPTMGA